MYPGESYHRRLESWLLYPGESYHRRLESWLLYPGESYHKWLESWLLYPGESYHRRLESWLLYPGESYHRRLESWLLYPGESYHRRLESWLLYPGESYHRRLESWLLYPGESYHWRLESWLLCLCCVFWALINSLEYSWVKIGINSFCALQTDQWLKHMSTKGQSTCDPHLNCHQSVLSPDSDWIGLWRTFSWRPSDAWREREVSAMTHKTKLA